MTFIDAGADRLWVEDTGGDDVPVVLLHPGIADSTIWDRMLPLLGERRVVRYDQRGFGRSPRATEQFTSLGDLVTVLDAVGAPRAHLVGNSMGGEAVLALAVTSPERVASMTLLCPGIGGYPWPEDDHADLAAAWERLWEARDVDGLTELQLGMWAASGVDDYLREQVRRTTELDFAQEDLQQPNPEQWEAAATLSVPTTVVAAEHDPADSLQASLDLAERIPDAQLLRLDTDHVPQYRDPRAVADALLDTIRRA
jgi:pimeloyl-ACP methyl ester carboxylesterase